MQLGLLCATEFSLEKAVLIINKGLVGHLTPHFTTSYLTRSCTNWFVYRDLEFKKSLCVQTTVCAHFLFGYLCSCSCVQFNLKNLLSTPSRPQSDCCSSAAIAEVEEAVEKEGKARLCIKKSKGQE